MDQKSPSSDWLHGEVWIEEAGKKRSDAVFCQLLARTVMKRNASCLNFGTIFMRVSSALNSISSALSGKLKSLCMAGRTDLRSSK